MKDAQEKIAELELVVETLRGERDAARRDQCQADGELFDNRAHIETLREALRVVLSKSENEYLCDVVSKALATTPTSGFVEKVRGLADAGENFRQRVLSGMHPVQPGPTLNASIAAWDEALTALYAEAPWLK